MELPLKINTIITFGEILCVFQACIPSFWVISPAPKDLKELNQHDPLTYMVFYFVFSLGLPPVYTWLWKLRLFHGAGDWSQVKRIKKVSALSAVLTFLLCYGSQGFPFQGGRKQNSDYYDLNYLILPECYCYLGEKRGAVQTPFYIVTQSC